MMYTMQYLTTREDNCENISRECASSTEELPNIDQPAQHSEHLTSSPSGRTTTTDRRAAALVAHQPLSISARNPGNITVFEKPVLHGFVSHQVSHPMIAIHGTHLENVLHKGTCAVNVEGVRV